MWGRKALGPPGSPPKVSPLGKARRLFLLPGPDCKYIFTLAMPDTIDAIKFAQVLTWFAFTALSLVVIGWVLHLIARRVERHRRRIGDHLI